jgi:release factor glutamine methyltransferase
MGADLDPADRDPADMTGTVTWRDLWAETASLVGDRTVARWLCEEASGTERDEFVAELDEPATERGVHHLDSMVARVRAGEPVQYVLGHWAFRHLDLMVDRRVLIPRPETELLVDHAIGAMAGRPLPLVAADLGTGSGALGLALASELWHDGFEVWLADVSPDALAVARANLSGIGRAATSVRVGEGSWFDALPDAVRGRLDVVVSNPPYIAVDDGDVEPIVRDWEPGMALFAGADGLDHVRVIVGEAPDWLAPDGVLLLEIGAGQGAAVAALAVGAGLIDVRVLPDLTGRDRFVQAKRAAT